MGLDSTMLEVNLGLCYVKLPKHSPTGRPDPYMDGRTETKTLSRLQQRQN